MATTATRKTYPVKFELFDSPEKLPAIIEMLLAEGFRVGISAQVIDGEPDYRITASKALGSVDNPDAPVSRMTATIGDVIVSDSGLVSQKDAELFLGGYDPPPADKTELEGLRDAKLAAAAAAEVELAAKKLAAEKLAADKLAAKESEEVNDAR